MKILLIDDLADKGWKSILELAVTKERDSIEIATKQEEAYLKLTNKYDLIFLDMRLSEEDHKVKNVEEYSGFKLLKYIKKDFTSINFSTPIILFTASTKIWNIDKFKEYGVDSFYIKEHPDHIYSTEFSKENLKNLQSNFMDLIEIGKYRNEIWSLCYSIIELLNKHNYFNVQDTRSINIKNRIEDKLKLGYGHLFTSTSKVENDVLLFDKEALSFIIFWSILEEISKGFTEFNATWNAIYERSGSWKFKNKEFFIEYISSEDHCVINYDSYSKKSNQIKEDKKYYNGVINLSEQIYALLYAYTDQSDFIRLSDKFREINSFRNKVDYIHSSEKNIFTKNLFDKSEISLKQNKILNVLEFIHTILKIN
ncbi:response regulator [Empedobacter stercoris]|uniref:response regulator n=1 Tax=Empedobacter stercoris TaxID=1628248 RepID=UPI0016625EBB|nr:response regulator [Empedobacter stercoris]MCA4809610.1 response regulator [Empedobacter stercoris]QNT13533.1 response regulator [Empedobacter stercoris]